MQFTKLEALYEESIHIQVTYTSLSNGFMETEGKTKTLKYGGKASVMLGYSFGFFFKSM